MRRHPPPPFESPPPHPGMRGGVMHDYNTKYGTLSGGSALSQSMRYAEPWLYGSMSARTSGSRPSILAYPEPTVILGTPLVMCACKDFLSGTTRSKKSSSAVCKKCGGSRKTSWNVQSPNAIRGFGTVRLSQPKSRPELPALEELKDPYDIMRKSRLAAVSSTLRLPSKGKSRAKSTSPSGRRRNRSKSPPPRHRSPDSRVVDMKSLNLNNLVDVNDSSSRKSILECDVNPYELITQYLKNGEPGDSRFSLDEEELSDNLSENVLDDRPVFSRSRTKSRDVDDSSKSKKLATANTRTKRGFLDALKSKREEPLQPLPGGVSIGGQRIRLFHTNDPIPSVTCANEFVSDSEENEEEVEEEIYDMEKHKAWFADNKNGNDSSKGSQNLRLSSSPKRPPRKPKSGNDLVSSKKDSIKNTNETGNKNRVNFALDVPSQSNRRSDSLTSAVSLEIKSILKKPNSTLNLSSGVRHPRAVTTSIVVPKPAIQSVAPTKSKDLNTFNPVRSANQQSQSRRKKQVQFNVSGNAIEDSLTKVEVEQNVPDSPESNPEVSIICEEITEIPRFQFFGDNQEDAQAVNQIPQNSENIAFPLEDSSEESGGRQNVSSLQRSLSDCMSPGGEPGSKFNDTMRLRLRSGRRDSRDAFPEDGRKRPERRVLSPGRPRPKEPPPPPPPPAPDSGSFEHSSVNRICNIETSVQQEQTSKGNPETNLLETALPPPPPPPPPRQIFPFTKEEIEHINQCRERRGGTRPRSSSNSPVRNNIVTLHSPEVSRRTSITLPVLEDGGTFWNQEDSVVKDDPSMILDEQVPAMEAFSCVTEVYEALEKNSKENEECEREVNDNMDKITEQSVKLIVPSASNTKISLKEKEFDQNCTVVTVSSPLQNVSVTNQKPFANKTTSIIITGKESDEVEHKVNKTSVLIGSYKSPEENVKSNKVTINVGGSDYQNDYIKTDKNNSQIEVKNNFKSNITIGSSDNNILTHLALESSAIPNRVEMSLSKESGVTTENNKLTIGKSIDSDAQEEMNKLIRNNIDPVEAARKNIVPHICGLGKITLEEVKERQSSKSTCFKLDSVEEEKRTENNLNHSDKDVIFNTLSSIESEENLEDDVFALKDDTDENSDCYVCAKKAKKASNDVEETKIGLEFDSDENHYEIIRDPIYEEISETPPPLPLSPPPTSADINDSIPTRSIFEGASKYDILNYLETAKERGIVTEPEDDLEVKSPEHSRISSLDLSSRISQLSNASDSSEDSCNLLITATDTSSITSDKVRKSSAEIERNDSGVGSESSKCSRSRWQHLTASQQHSCEDCDQPVETQVTDSGLMFAPLVCRKCAKRRSERREIITEIVETEEKYGRDLKIMLDEFYRPMLVAGLLTPEQLSAIFLNVEELLENNATLAEKLRDALEIAIDQGDEDLLTVNIGSIFLDAVPMLHAFESYCTRQGTASLLLANLEKEKELLRIFLRVSQMENSVLRRMNLNSFLMVPVQRVTKYPLLLARLYRVTPAHLKSRDTLRLAQSKIELHLEHINSLAKDISSTKLWRRISIINGRRPSSENDMINIKLRKVAVNVLEWNHDEVRFAVEGKLLYTQPTDNNWRRGRTIKLTPVNAMLVTLGKPTVDYHPEADELLAFPRKNGIRDATLLLLREKSGRYGLLREPLFLDRCIICCEADIEDYFEVQELATKDTYLFKAEDGDQTKRWFKQLQYHAQGLGAWRKRRNALANIMINGMQLRT